MLGDDNLVDVFTVETFISMVKVNGTTLFNGFSSTFEISGEGYISAIRDTIINNYPNTVAEKQDKYKDRKINGDYKYKLRKNFPIVSEISEVFVDKDQLGKMELFAISPGESLCLFRAILRSFDIGNISPVVFMRMIFFYYDNLSDTEMDTLKVDFFFLPDLMEECRKEEIGNLAFIQIFCMIFKIKCIIILPEGKQITAGLNMDNDMDATMILEFNILNGKSMGHYNCIINSRLNKEKFASRIYSHLINYTFSDKEKF